MWKVVRGDKEASAQEVFGAICVSEASAKTIFGDEVVLFKSEHKAVRGDLGAGPLYCLEALARLNGTPGCSADRKERLYTIPAPEAQES